MSQKFKVTYSTLASPDPMLDQLMNMSLEDLKKEYVEREIEPETAGDDWKPKEAKWLLEEYLR